jgi:predicted benzoate:H+ symporter BenE
MLIRVKEYPMSSDPSKDPFDRWYLRLVAGLYMIACSLCLAYYLFQNLSRTGASIPWQVQTLCLAGALSGFVYFVRPRLGYLGLFWVTVIVLFLAMGRTEPEPLVFHAIVLTILWIPLVTSLLHRRHQLMLETES